MNPADARCPAWTIFNDCTSYSNFTAAAAALIPSDGGGGDLFWVLAARTLLIEICMKLMDEGLTSSQVLAENLMTADLKLVYKHLSNTVADPITVPEAVKMAESIRAVFNTNAHILRFLPDEGEEYSIKAWMTAEKERGLILFITSNYTDLEMNRTLLTLRFNLAIHSLMMMSKIRSLRIWFLFDEIGASHRLPAIESGLQTARNFGGAMVFELHSFDKLVQVYGEENARNLSSLARTNLSSRQPISTPPSRVLATSAIARSGRWMPIIGYLAWIRDLSPPDWSIFREKFSFRFGRCRTRELELQLRNKTPKRKVKAKLRDDRTPATAPNECWSMDFLSDQLFDGSKIRVLSIVDNFTRVSPALDVRTSYRGSDVVDTLDRIALAHGRPKRIRLDNGPEFISKDLDLWAYQHDVVLDFSRPGKPTDNAFAEAFNGRVRAECLNAYWFLSLDDARVKCEAWRRDYSEHRPHSSLGNQTPMERAFSSGQACLP